MREVDGDAEMDVARQDRLLPSKRALMSGKASNREACRARDERADRSARSRAPSWNASLRCRRTRSSAVKSTSIAWKTCGIVRQFSASRSPVLSRTAFSVDDFALGGQRTRSGEARRDGGGRRRSGSRRAPRARPARRCGRRPGARTSAASRRDVEPVLRDQPARERRDAHAVRRPWPDRSVQSGSRLPRTASATAPPSPRSRRSDRPCARRAAADHRDDLADLRHDARADADLVQPARDDRLDFDRHLVGLDLEQVVALLDLVADRLEPGEDLALRNGFAELRHDDESGSSA